MTLSLFIPMFAHLLLVIVLYALLTVMRASAVWGIGKTADGTNPYSAMEKRVSANLSNQFEFPIFFYVICALLIAVDLAGVQVGNSVVFIGLAWLFIVGRVIHSLVQILTNNIRLRGLIFTVNFVAVIAMWVLFLIKINVHN